MKSLSIDLLYSYNQLLKQNQFIPLPNQVLSFSEVKLSQKYLNNWIDFFIDDRRFWQLLSNPYKYLPFFRSVFGVVGIDLSALQDMTIDQRKKNIATNRMMDAFFQANDIPYIPVASWAYLDDFSWCLNKLPKNSSIAISTNGCINNFISRNTLVDGIEILQKELTPSNLVICGGPLKEIDNRYNNIHYYKNFSQRMNDRINLRKQSLKY